MQETGGKDVMAVAAREQLRGRGTRGRKWEGLRGNVFLTVAIPLNRVPVPLSLIPLRVGTLIAPGELVSGSWEPGFGGCGRDRTDLVPKG